jgi:type II secretory ATPase GspE/PulE/Tfp pilus assembly ATPase PilB-like protein
MRQDPQVIMVGEIRDAETAAIAVQAGLTGHLVISTIHSGSTAGVFARLINMDIEPFLLASSVTGVLGLRLVRKNCSDCAQPYEPQPGYMKLIPAEDWEAAQFRRGGGCDQCLGTGFSGRFSIGELLPVTQRFRDAVLEKLSTRALQQVAMDEGMQTMWSRGLHRALIGQTSLEEILRVISVDEL